MGPRGPSRASKNRKPAFAKTLKSHKFFKVYGGPQLSKTAYEDAWRLARVFLGLFEAILSHLEGILGSRALKIAPGKVACIRISTCWRFPGSILCPILTMCCCFLESFLGPVFWHLLNHFCDHFWIHVGTRSDQEGTKLSRRGPSRALKIKKTALAKTLGCPRWPQNAQEGSQEAPKEFQNLKTWDPKTNPKIIICLAIFGAILGSWGHLGPSWGHLGAILGYLRQSWIILGASWNPFWANLELSWAI